MPLVPASSSDFVADASASPALPRRRGGALLVLAILIHLFYLGALAGVGGHRLDLWTFDSHQFIGHQGADFYVLPEAGWDFLHGENIYLHDNATTRTPYHLTFRYLPFFACTLGVLLALIPPAASYWVWVLVNEALLLFNLWLTWRRTRSGWGRVGAVWLWLAPFPVFLEQWLGQFSILMGSLLFWAGLRLADGLADWRADLAWTGSALLKNYSLLMTPLWLRLGRWRGVVFCFALAALTSLPYFLLFPGSWTLFRAEGTAGRLAVGSFGYPNPSFTEPPALYWGCQGLQTALQALVNAVGLGWTQVGGLRVGLLLIAAISLALMLPPLLLTFRRDLNPVAVFCLWAMSFFILYRDFWEHHYVLLLPVVALAGLYLRPPRAWLVLAVVLISLPTPWRILGFPLGQKLLHQSGLYEPVRLLYFLIKPLGGLMVYLLLFRAALKKSDPIKPPVSQSSSQSCS